MVPAVTNAPSMRAVPEKESAARRTSTVDVTDADGGRTGQKPSYPGTLLLKKKKKTAPNIRLTLT